MSDVNMDNKEKHIDEGDDNFTNFDAEFDLDIEDAVLENAKSISFTNVLSTGNGNDVEPTGEDLSFSEIHHSSKDEIVTDYKDLDLEFETFNGSLKDNVEYNKAPISMNVFKKNIETKNNNIFPNDRNFSIKETSTTLPSPVFKKKNIYNKKYVDTETQTLDKFENNEIFNNNLNTSYTIPQKSLPKKFVSEDLETTISDSIMSTNNTISTNNTTATPYEDAELENCLIPENEKKSTLNILKTRDNNSLNKESITRRTSLFKPVAKAEKLKIDQILSENELKIQNLNILLSKKIAKIEKIKKEIEFLNQLNSQTTDLNEMAKLKIARNLLVDSLESIDKERYETNIKLNKLINKSSMIHGGDYWIRNVS
ncbi:hypothetical protein PACTADRAFT_49074 [Pachysolen tannophilus NRRL Y-2460]|uniref:Uncharacterized protein n=1 Tax=Pachysolen tannophilus NRRL Y-2460 TaxID=669874 RepID=A0A1E4U031_PACTA|nr:hypothetical protein PACTADRAFT_49074 [Pachysolen tannophilus NRRL Y-2460]